jgi:hypothetical protein
MSGLILSSDDTKLVLICLTEYVDNYYQLIETQAAIYTESELLRDLTTMNCCNELIIKIAGCFGDGTAAEGTVQRFKDMASHNLVATKKAIEKLTGDNQLCQ